MELRLDNIHHSYPPQPGGEPVEVLRGVTLTASPDQLTVIAGRSGSGKTTLLRVACGLLQPDKGEVWSDDLAIHTLSENDLAAWRRHNLGVVVQGGGLIDTLTAGENVALASFGEPPSDTRDRVVHLLTETGVAPRANHFPDQLSGGEQQRVAIARALYSNPRLMVADEPTANLDRATADRIIDLLRSMRSGRAVLIASHDQTLIERADHVLWLD